MTKSLKVLRTLLFALVILSLVACGSAQPTARRVAPTSEPAPTTGATGPPAAKPVPRTLGSCRTDEAGAWAEKWMASQPPHPAITGRFAPTNPRITTPHFAHNWKPA